MLPFSHSHPKHLLATTILVVASCTHWAVKSTDTNVAVTLELEKFSSFEFTELAGSWTHAGEAIVLHREGDQIRSAHVISWKCTGETVVVQTQRLELTIAGIDNRVGDWPGESIVVQMQMHQTDIIHSQKRWQGSGESIASKVKISQRT